ncbi:MAG: hypothetical protein MR303_01870 [Emergencia sp.]|nr:hypothetical protein [Emergencia sp.]
MKIHYFQRYHAKENVATANTMLLLSRLYSYSSNKFFRLLKSEFFEDSFEPEIVFTLQEKSVDSVPDATITQDSFKIVVETKMSDWFHSEQLMKHLEAFKDERHKVLMTLAPEHMKKVKKEEFEKQLKAYNKEHTYPIMHINTTFERLAKAIEEVLDDRDYEMQEVLEDYLDYCYADNLVSGGDAWNYMRMQLAGVTMDFNISEGVYYDDVARGFRAHDFLGLYSQKSVRAIGKVCARITAIETDVGMEYNVEFGELTDERKAQIQRAIANGDEHGYDLHSIKHRYFFVDKFYETDFKKTTPGPSRGTRIFDLTQVLGVNKLPETAEIAEMLRNKTWG